MIRPLPLTTTVNEDKSYLHFEFTSLVSRFAMRTIHLC